MMDDYFDIVHHNTGDHIFERCSETYRLISDRYLHYKKHGIHIDKETYAIMHTTLYEIRRVFKLYIGMFGDEFDETIRTSITIMDSLLDHRLIELLVEYDE